MEGQELKDIVAGILDETLAPSKTFSTSGFDNMSAILIVLN